MNIRATYTPYLKKKHKDDHFGYLTIRETINRNSVYYSLSVPLFEKDWDRSRCKVKSRHQESEMLNDLIESKIRELKLEKESASVVSKTQKKVKTTMNDVFQDQWSHQSRNNRHGTAKTIKTCSNHFQEFLFERGLDTISPDEIDTLFVRDFETYLVSRGLNENSAKKYVAVFRKVFGQGVTHGLILTNNNPFSAFKASRKDTPKDCLTKSEVERLMFVDLSRNPVLDEIRNQFLFQLFGQGLRISDLMTLKWRNYDGLELRFTQFKTKKEHTLYLNKHSLRILGKQLPNGIDDLQNMKISGRIEDTSIQLTYDDWTLRFKEYSKQRIGDFMNGDPKAIKEVEDFKSELDRIEMGFNLLLDRKFKEHASLRPDDFIFGILPSDRFRGIQFNMNTILPSHLYKLMSSKTALYNSRLKRLQELAGLNKTLTSHLMRSTFATILYVDGDEDIYMVSKMLGHSKVSTTEAYLKSNMKRRKDIATDKFAGMFH
jgi:site-specific recombinase XerD